VNRDMDSLQYEENADSNGCLAPMPVPVGSYMLRGRYC
jgi:hypothetical protein